MEILQDAVSRALAQGLDLQTRRQELLTANLANADTPGYQPVDLEFEGTLQMAVADDARPPGMQRTDAMHLASSPLPAPPADSVVLRPDVSDSLDGNGVDLDREVTRFADNAARFRATAEAMRRRLALVAYVISQAGGR